MVDPSLPPLSDWETFYVITGSAAAALTGLMFVVIALRTEAIVEGIEGGVRAFATPNVAPSPVHRHPQRMGRGRVDRREAHPVAVA